MTYFEFTTDVIDVPWKLPPCPGLKAGKGSGWKPGKTPFAPNGFAPLLVLPPDSPNRLFRFGWLTPTGTKPKFWGNPELNGKPF